MKNIYYIFIALMAMGLVSCQKEELHTGPCEVRVRAYLQDEVTVTRYSDVTNSDDFNGKDFNAGLFISDGTNINRAMMSKKDNTLITNLRLEKGDYWFYGYLPYRDEASFANSTMTVPNVPGIDASNVLLIRMDEELNTQLTITDEDITNKATKTVYLKMDHLMAKVTPRFYIDATYAEMRSIRIKKVEFAIDGASTYTAKVDYTTPATPAVAWEETDTKDLTATAYENASPTEDENLKTSKDKAQECGACYVCPDQLIDGLSMTVTYDVYDTKGQLLRPDNTATNKMKIKVSGNTLTKLEAGNNYLLNIKIVPTYLYVLSDNDEESVLLIN